jgi:hypothetical protein
VLCADEKTQLQALSRRHRDLPAAPGRARRTEVEYRRGGTLAYLAADDPHAARVLGHTAPTTGIAPFAELVEQVMTTQPYASAAPGCFGSSTTAAPTRVRTPCSG